VQEAEQSKSANSNVSFEEMTMPSMQHSARSGVFMAAALLTACGSGPSESEFAAACMQEGQRGVNMALSREMGVHRDAFCRCTAKEAKALVSADGYRWMMLDMQGSRQEAATLQAKMTETDRMDVMKAAMTVLGKCTAAR
jgi:hypothetical protein